ncbi:MAG: arginine--tRNA ligase [Candidatus Omnitrophica bacterium]|nr:arginine--tRNA ligase [Candidatus Omnitrophota bacterium]
MSQNIEEQLADILIGSIKDSLPAGTDLPLIEWEIPIEKEFGDISTTLALKSAKILRKPPMVIAQELVIKINALLEKSKIKSKIAKVEVKNPGFINFFFSTQFFRDILEGILKADQAFGKLDYGKNEKLMIEFVSANPTGPLSVAHARQAAVGDALVNILRHIGFDAKKEYYVNDGGNQIRILGNSVRLRANEILGRVVEYPEDHYQGDYIRDMAQLFLDKHSIKNLEQLDALTEQEFKDFAGGYLLEVNRKELEDFGVQYDCWSFESKVAGAENIKKVLEEIARKGLIYEKDGALWFKTTDLGDDKDRVVRKSDGSYTYLAPDIVYHKNKFDRGFSRVFDILGPDHHGYIPRLKAAAQALGRNKDDIEVLIVQLATIFRDGQVLSMSTRKGQYITLREVLEEVGKDASRYFFLMRHIKAQLEFDLEVAKKQTAENPVYYIQYAHARVHSINEKAAACGISAKGAGFRLLNEEEEINLIKKINGFSSALLVCYKQMDPYPLASYMLELATAFHKFYDRHRVITEDQDLSSERLALANAARTTLANGLRLIGVSAPSKM